MRGSKLIAVLGAALLLSAPACGSDDDDAAGESEEAAAPADDEGGETDGSTEDPEGAGSGGGDAAECPEAPFVGTIERIADDSLGHRAATLETADVVDAVGYEFLGAYTLYVADHEIDRAPFAEWAEGTISTENAVEAEEGGTLAYVGFGDYGPGGGTLEVGDTLDASAASEIFVAIDAGGGAAVISDEHEGELTVLGIEDDRVCIEMDYRDTHQEVQGTLSVELYRR